MLLLNKWIDDEIILAVVVTTIAFLLLVFFSITYLLIYRRKRKAHKTELTEFKKQFENQLLRAQIEVQEQTFQQIGKELHDNVGQLLSTSKMLLGFTERNIANPPDSLHTATETIGEAINQLRALSKSLDKEWLEQFSFSDNLKNEITRINHGGDIVHAEVIQLRRDQLRAEEQIMLFRVVQEAIQNAIKHADAKMIFIKMKLDNDMLHISIADDGKGFQLTESDNSMGLKNMRHRTALLNGRISWDAASEKGTKIEISLPVK